MDVLVVAALALGVLLAGAVAALLLEQRRSALLRRGGVTDARTVADRALRTLAAGCAAIGRDLPSVYAVRCTQRRVILLLPAPDTHAPPPWKSAKTGESWTVSRAVLTDSGGPQPFPFTVTLGLLDRDPVLFDLARPRGAVAITGAPSDVQRFASGLVAQILAGPMGEPGEVVLVGSRAAAALADRAGLRTARLRAAATLEEVLATTVGARADMTEIYGLIHGVAQPVPPRLLVMDAAQFQAPPRDCPVLVLGDVPEAAWRLTITAGTLDTGALGLTLSLGMTS
jgi:hypothetical protein